MGPNNNHPWWAGHTPLLQRCVGGRLAVQLLLLLSPDPVLLLNAQLHLIGVRRIAGPSQACEGILHRGEVVGAGLAVEMPAGPGRNGRVSRVPGDTAPGRWGNVRTRRTLQRA